MRIIRTRDYNHMSEHAAAVIAAQLTLQPNSTLGLATGSTPLGAYVRLVEMCAAGKISFAQVQSYNLDEYRGLTHDDPQSYHHFMWENLFSRVDIDVTRTHVPDGSNEDAASTCANYDAAIEAAGGIDLQLLGIGNNGHIGFNEPGDEFVVGTHCVNLTESTIKANSRLFESIEAGLHPWYRRHHACTSHLGDRERNGQGRCRTRDVLRARDAGLPCLRTAAAPGLHCDS